MHRTIGPDAVALNRRTFLGAAGGLGAAALAARGGFLTGRDAFGANEPTPAPQTLPHELTVVSGDARQRGLAYGRKFKQAIRGFAEREIFSAFIGKPATRDEMLRYAAACLGAIQQYSPQVSEEMAGVAAGADMPIEEIALASAHEELYHRGVLPAMSHCTAVAVGPPESADGRTLVGQTWDWMPSVFGLSSMVLWKRDQGPNILCYSYPGLWAGAGLNSAGLALCWTSANLKSSGKESPIVGIPAYALIAHLLSQDSLEAVIEEARRATIAGWFTFVLADGQGRLLNLEGAPGRLVAEHAAGRLVRVDYGSREMTETPAGADVDRHPRCYVMEKLLATKSGGLDQAAIGEFFCDPSAGICNATSTLDAMVFDTTSREARVTRGLGSAGQWRRFGFDSEEPGDWQSLFDGESLAGWRLSRFGGDGEAGVEEGQLVIGAGVTLTGVVHDLTDLPRLDYEVALDARRVEGFDFFCGLTFPVGDDFCSLIVGGWGGAVVGLSCLDGLDASENETTCSMRFETARWYAVRLRVQGDRIRAWIDDEMLVDADTRARKIAIRPDIAASKPFGLANYCTKAAFKNVRIRRLDGAAG